jgi:hypothetical protein
MAQSKFSDFLNFRVMITPFVIVILFWVGLVAVLIAAIVLFARGLPLVGLGTIVVGPFAWRLTCEYSILLFKMHDCLEQIARNTGTNLLGGDSIGKAVKGTSGGTGDSVRDEYGVLGSEVLIGAQYSARDGTSFRVIEFMDKGIRVEFSPGKEGIIHPIDPTLPEGQWAFDINVTRKS